MTQAAFLIRSGTLSSLTKTYIALDYGLRRIGIAVGNSLIQTTQGLNAISAKAGNPNWQALNQIISEWDPDALVLGEPLGPDGEQTEFSRQVRHFGKSLELKTGLPVYFADERHTTRRAEAMLRESVETGKRFNRRKIAAKDSLAAELILHTFFSHN